MDSRFRYEVESFLSENMVAYRISAGRIFIPDYKVVLSLVEINQGIPSVVEIISAKEGRCEVIGFCNEPKSESNSLAELEYESGAESRGEFAAEKGYKQFTIYEDLWFTKGDIIRNRLLANFGRGTGIFARRCTVEKISAEVAREFLEINHLIGDARGVFRYGLFYAEELVAVATFSASRPINRENRVVRSYEWVRYASKSSLRIVGGMGKLLNYFVVSEKPEEIMSYADVDWSDGDVYRKLGFKQIGVTSPVEFYVNIETYERIPAKKLLRDRKYRVTDNISAHVPGRYISILNSGNLKFLRSFSLF